MPGKATLAGVVIALVVVAAMALDTKVVPIGSDARPASFSPETFGATQFPKVQAGVEELPDADEAFDVLLAVAPGAAGRALGVDEPPTLVHAEVLDAGAGEFDGHRDGVKRVLPVAHVATSFGLSGDLRGPATRVIRKV